MREQRIANSALLIRPRYFAIRNLRSIAPALRLADEEIAERLHARDRLELFRIDEERVERDRVGLAEHLDEAAVLFDQVVGQHRHAEPALTGAQDAEHVVDGQ